MPSQIMYKIELFSDNLTFKWRNDSSLTFHGWRLTDELNGFINPAIKHVIPAAARTWSGGRAGIQEPYEILDSRLRGNDETINRSWHVKLPI